MRLKCQRMASSGWMTRRLGLAGVKEGMCVNEDKMSENGRDRLGVNEAKMSENGSFRLNVKEVF